MAALALGCGALAWWSGQVWLATVAFLGLVLSAVWLGLRLAATARSLRAALQDALRTRQVLASSLDTLDVGLEIYDEQDRLVMYNKRINLMHPHLHCPDDIGKTFVPLVRTNIERGLIPAAVGREDAWLAERMATRGTRAEPLLQELAGDQWIHTYETRTPEGYLVAVRVDVTELVRKGRALEASNRLLAQQSLTDSLTGMGNRRLAARNS